MLREGYEFVIEQDQLQDDEEDAMPANSGQQLAGQ